MPRTFLRVLSKGARHLHSFKGRVHRGVEINTPKYMDGVFDNEHF